MTVEAWTANRRAFEASWRAGGAVPRDGDAAAREAAWRAWLALANPAQRPPAEAPGGADWDRGRALGLRDSGRGPGGG